MMTILCNVIIIKIINDIKKDKNCIKTYLYNPDTFYLKIPTFIVSKFFYLQANCLLSLVI